MDQNQQMKNEAAFLDEIHVFLKSVSLNLQDILSDFANYPPALVFLDSELTLLQKQSHILHENVMQLIDVQLNGTQKAMASACSELWELRRKYKCLQKEWDSQQEHLGRVQAELFRARNQLQQQSQFCASLGACTGNLLWKASRIPPVIDMLLAGNKIGDFMCIVSGSLASFLDTYGSSLPDQNADESQFIMSMCGIITNVAAAPAGRQYLVSDPTGKELLTQCINVLPTIPTPVGNFLKRLVLMALYNTSINQNGLRFMQEQDSLLPVIAQCLEFDDNHELKLMSLRLLQSITYDIPSCLVLKNILDTIPAQLMEDLRLSPEADFRSVAQQILQNLKRAQVKFNVKFEEEPPKAPAPSPPPPPPPPPPTASAPKVPQQNGGNTCCRGCGGGFTSAK